MRNLEADTGSSFLTGWLVKSKAGHDKGMVYIIMSVKDDGVYVSDGRLKTAEKPKRKNPKHLQPIRVYGPGLLLPERKEAIHVMQTANVCGEASDVSLQPEKLRNEDIIYILRQYGRNKEME